MRTLENASAWRFHGDTALLQQLYPAMQQAMQDGHVKSNDKRVVFRLENAGKAYFTKFEFDSNVLRRLLGPLLPSKAASEYRSALRLNAAGIPVVQCVGYGEQAGQSLLVTEALSEEYVSGEVFWYRDVIGGGADHQPFCVALQKLLANMLAVRVHHPDLHLGNVFFSSVRQECVLLDVYGVRVKRRFSHRDQDLLLRILPALRYRLPPEEIIAMLGSFSQVRNPQQTWERYLTEATQQADAVWPRRREQILAGYAKYVSHHRYQGNDMVLRKQLAFADPAPDTLTSEAFAKRTFSQADARTVWLRSFLLQLKCIAHVRPLAWIPGAGEVWFESVHSSDAPAVGPESFMDYCLTLGIPHEALRDNVCWHQGQWVIRDIARIPPGIGQ